VNTSSQPSDLALLRATFGSWEFEAAWTSAASGPDYRHLLARKGDVTLAAHTAEDLAAQVVAADIAAALHHQETGCTDAAPCTGHDPGAAS
jgi:hypothetical protein